MVSLVLLLATKQRRGCQMDKLLRMGFLKSEKSGEKRIAILPKDLKKVAHCEQLYFEEGYGSDFQIEDQEYLDYGTHVVSKNEVLKMDILCEPKIGEAAWLYDLPPGKILFGWIHAGADPKLTSMLVKQKHDCYAWEDMYEAGRHVFWKNNQIAGSGGVLNALQYTGWLPYGKKAAIIGRGDVAFGAYRILSNLGADVSVYSRTQEELFQIEASDMDIIVMAIRWDTARIDHILTDSILEILKKDAIIVDVSADVNGSIENSVTTSIDVPTYYLHKTLVYSVNNVPSIFYKTATEDISNMVSMYIDQLIEGEVNSVLRDAKIISDGCIWDKRIILAQNR